MFNKTYTIVADNFKGERVTEVFTGNFISAGNRITAIKKHGFHIQSVIKSN